MSAAVPAVEVRGLHKRFRGRGDQPDVVALKDVSLAVRPGSTLGVVGESGSGKSTLARCILGLERPDAGEVSVLGRPITGASPGELRRWRRDFQVVFQEPLESLSPRVVVKRAIAEPLLLHTELRGQDLDQRVDQLLALVALSSSLRDRYPHQLSGGQQQRVNIARALATNPQVVVLDEPTSSLDVSVRAEILDLLKRLQRELGLTYLLISHDLTTIRYVCDRVAVMCLGRLVEQGETARVLSDPRHPYTTLLLESELTLDLDAERHTPRVAEPLTDPSEEEHCVFVDRCPSRILGICTSREPGLEAVDATHDAACFAVNGQGSPAANGAASKPLSDLILRSSGGSSPA
jgi:oligopeptide/dipeptide ABC transporter ATP-binding protein